MDYSNEDLAAFAADAADEQEATGDPFPWSEQTTRLNRCGSYSEWNASRQRDRREWENDR